MKLLCIIAAAMALVVASSTAMAAPKKRSLSDKATHRMKSPRSVPAPLRQWPPNNPTFREYEDFNAKVGTKQIRLDASRCASRDPAGFRQDDVDDVRVTKNETLVRRGKKWFRYDAPDKLLFNQLRKTLMTSPD